MAHEGIPAEESLAVSTAESLAVSTAESLAVSTAESLAVSTAESLAVSMLSDLFDAGVAHHTLHDFALAEPLWDEELQHIERAVDKRRQEFGAGRTCARRAMAQLGLEACALPAGDDRSVRWPEGVVGSITHTDSFAAAALASTDKVAGLGIDAEQRDRVHEKLWRYVARPEEIAWLEEDSEQASDRAVRLFSGKEAFYKAQYCISASFLGFKDVSYAEIDGGFVVQLEKSVPALGPRGQRYRGRFAMTDQLAITAVTIPAVAKR